MKLKREFEKVMRTSISMPPRLFEAGLERRVMGFGTFSNYVQALIRADQQQGILGPKNQQWATSR